MGENNNGGTILIALDTGETVKIEEVKEFIAPESYSDNRISYCGEVVAYIGKSKDLQEVIALNDKTTEDTLKKTISILTAALNMLE